ncbi:MAG: hypothetical protein LUE25_01780, partial [Clostridiales bacterium]|nr:hypothetical protein [Clostridiales bacterium]
KIKKLLLTTFLIKKKKKKQRILCRAGSCVHKRLNLFNLFSSMEIYPAGIAPHCKVTLFFCLTIIWC